MLEAWKECFEVTEDGSLLRTSIKGRSIEPRKVGTKDGAGYLQCSFNNKQYRVHRIIFALHYGYLPDVIDHIDGDILNNRPDNLREVTFSQNGMNAKLSAGSSTGVKGVSYHPAKGKYIAYITVNRSRKWLGHFNTLNEAKLARENAACKLHGEFQRGGGGVFGDL